MFVQANELKAKTEWHCGNKDVYDLGFKSQQAEGEEAIYQVGRWHVETKINLTNKMDCTFPSPVFGHNQGQK